MKNCNGFEGQCRETMPKCDHGIQYPTLVVDATSYYSHVKISKWYFIKDQMMWKNREGFIILFKLNYLKLDLKNLLWILRSYS